MRYTKALFTTTLLALVLSTGCTGCTQIKLSGTGKSGNVPQPMPMTGGSPSAQTPASAPPNGAAPPPLQDEWEVDFTVPNGDAQISTVVLSQQGNALVGDGTDQSGRTWQLQEGQVNGLNVTFSKVYTDRPDSPPINYVGQLKYEQSPEFTGWLMEGTYSVKTANGVVQGKWVSNPTGASGTEAPAETTEQPTEAPPPAGQPAAPAPPSKPLPDHIGDDKPTDLTGKYFVSYQYNFKNVKGHMFLEHDGGKLGGHGVDTSNNESYNLESGKYKYPDISFIRCYVKGKGAKNTRKVLFRATISSDAHMIIMKGETQFGGRWDAKLARLR